MGPAGKRECFKVAVAEANQVHGGVAKIAVGDRATVFAVGVLSETEFATGELADEFAMFKGGGVDLVVALRFFGPDSAVAEDAGLNDDAVSGAGEGDITLFEGAQPEVSDAFTIAQE